MQPPPATGPSPAVEPTRLLITNLHPSVAAHHLREHLLACPPAPPGITDLKVLSRPNGSSRCIAFAGFHSSADADRVKRWALGAWVAGDRGGARIKVDWAKDARDAPRPAKRHKRSDEPSAPARRDDRFIEFMAVMAPARLNAGLSNADVSSTADRSRQLEDAAAPPQPPSASSSSATVAAAPVSAPPDGPAVVPVVELDDGAAGDVELSDADYLARRMKRRIDEVDDEGPSANLAAQDPLWVQEDGDGLSTSRAALEGPGPARAAEEVTLPSAPEGDALARQTILDTARLFVRNLPFTATTQDLEQLFGAHGPVEQVHIPVDKRTTTPKGLAYVTFVSPSDAVAAFCALDGTTFQGRLLHILPAIGRGERAESLARPATLKEDRLERRKQSAGQSFSWGALYLNTDAALSAVADRLGIAKSVLLDPSASDPAVKVALAEAHTLAETKRYFEDENVNVDAFSRPGPRSSTCILVKNLPYGTTAASLHSLFAPHGLVRRLLVPASGLIAIVELEDAASASAAWRALVYKQFSGSVLYLEKAPAAIFTPDAGSSSRNEPATRPVVPAASSTSSPLGPPAHDAPEPSAATLFVKNLNFATTTPRLKAAFDALPDVVFARVQTKADPAQPGRTLSMGFGFVGFRSVAAAASAKDARQGFVLDGHSLDVRFAQRNVDKDPAEKPSARAQETSTKLLVKNVPFEASRADLRQLFGTYGTLKSVRLPRKMDNKTRGFAFLEFATRRDAEAAFDALEHTHLLGRHLVLQWAGAEDGLERDGERPSTAAVVGAPSRRAAKTKFAM
ncbi:hypothetical protein JCM9279_003443 [Rhodotorula babjevae]